MNPIRLITAALLVSSNANGAEPQRPDDGGIQQWTLRSGTVIDAYFVSMSSRQVKLSKGIEERIISAEDLSPEGVEQAAELAKVIHIYQRVREGTFDMGSKDSEPGRAANETYRPVETSPFSIKATEVTWCEWNRVREHGKVNGYFDLSAGGNGMDGADADLNPVVEVSWWDALKWCNLKSQIESRKPCYRVKNTTGKDEIFKTGTAVVTCDWKADGYRLPTEAEWEFACRTRNSRWTFHTGQISDTGVQPVDRNMDQAGWFAGNSEGKPHPVALKRPNAFKLHDMHGNAAEWCWDNYTNSLGTTEAIDPKGPASGDHRVVRGGSWNNPAANCRAASRASLSPGSKRNTVGFRIVIGSGPAPEPDPIRDSRTRPRQRR
ncbi:MAG: formylglycine-generating enzyme family protein [Verrucomicrobiae bacterium]|nr:formylglycine-generating enzyme family protein [Verrucomicrobiae bacterium]